MLKDTVAKSGLDRLGFTKIALGNESMVDKLQEIYLANYGNLNGDMTVTHNHDNGIDPLAIHEQIVAAVKPYFESSFQEFKFLASHFVIKKQHSDTYFQLHQDWNVVDEQKYYNYQVWIPLDISYPENGGLCFLPESHLHFNNIRSGSNGLPLIELDEQLHPYLSYLRLIPGEAAIFFSKTFHGSFINSSKNDRVAILVNIIQEKSQSTYFHRNEQGLIEEYAISTEEIFKYLPDLEKGLLPFQKEALSSFSAPKIDLSLKDLLDFAASENVKKGRSRFYEHKLFHVLKNEEIEIDLNRKGYKVIDLLSTSEIDLLQIKMDELFPYRAQYAGTFSSVSAFNKLKRKEVHEYIVATIQERLEIYFKNFQIPLSLFYSRKPDKQYHLDWHHDPSLILNEHLEPLYGLWCPLVDVDNSHGALKLIPGSHRWINKLNLAYKIVNWPFENERDYLNKFALDFKLKAGQAILFDARIIHGSEPNRSTIFRDNIVMRICHEKSTFFNIVNDAKDAKTGTLYAQNNDFFFTDTLKNHVGVPETGRLIGEVSIFDDEITQEFIDSRIDLFKDAFQ